MSAKQSKSVKKAVAPKTTKAATKKAVPVKKVVAPKKAAATKKVATKKVATKKVATKKPVAKKGGAKAAKAVKAVAVADGEETGTKTRFFKVVDGDSDLPHGRFSGSKPKQAANKALTSILKSKIQNGGGVTGKFKFSIIECTRGSKHKKYHYVGERVKLKEPMEVTIGKGPDAKVITYKFNNRVMKDKTVAA